MHLFPCIRSASHDLVYGRLRLISYMQWPSAQDANSKPLSLKPKHVMCGPAHAVLCGCLCEEATDSRLLFDQKKNHMQARCDEEKPCARCVRRKTQDTCVPLRDDDDQPGLQQNPKKGTRGSARAREREGVVLLQRPVSRAGAPPALADAGMFVLDVCTRKHMRIHMYEHTLYVVCVHT